MTGNNGLLSLVSRRLVQAIFVLLGISIATFALLNFLPGNAAEAILGTQATKQSLEALTKQLKLNEPVPQRFWDWFTGALHGDLGQSLQTSDSVSHLLWTHAPVTLELILLSMIISVVFAVPLALKSAYRPDGWFDRTVGAASMAGLSIPGFVLALVLSLIFAVHLKLLPAVGYVSLTTNPLLNLRSLILPAITIALSHLATYTRLLRADLVDQIRTRDYIAAGRAKGLTRWQVLIRHGLRNASVGFITVVGVNIGTLLGATVIVESIFGIPGLGGQLIQAINTRDATVVQGTVLVMAVAVVAANLITDLLYAVLDPRVRYSSHEN